MSTVKSPLARRSFHRARERERGAVLLELSLSVIFLAVLSMGVAEYGTLFGSAIDVSSGVRSAVLAGTATGETAVPDKEVVNAALDLHGGAQRNVKRVMIYKADPTKPGPPDACVASTGRTVAGLCNIYYPQDFGLSESQMASLTQSGWPASSRKLGEDFMGVWLDVTKKNMQKIVWAPDRITDYQVGLIDSPRKAVAPVNVSTGFGPGPQSPITVTKPMYTDWTTDAQGPEYDGSVGGSTGGS